MPICICQALDLLQAWTPACFGVSQLRIAELVEIVCLGDAVEPQCYDCL